jgi:membrane protein
MHRGAKRLTVVRPHHSKDGHHAAGTAKAARTAGHKALSSAQARYRESLWQRFFHKLGELEFFDQTMLFAAGLLVSLVPFLILVSAFASQRVDDDIALRMGLDHRAAAIVSDLFKSSTASLDAGTVINLLILLAGAVTVASSLQVIYERVFQLDHRRNVARLLVWTSALCGLLVVESIIDRSAQAASGRVGLVEVATIATFTPFYWWTMHYLLGGRVGWRGLLPSAISTGVFFAGLGVFSSLYFSSSIISDSKTYGTIGAVLSLVTWFIAVGAVIILGAVAGAVWRDRKAYSERQEP